MTKPPRKTAARRAAAQKRKSAGPDPADTLEQIRPCRLRHRRDLLHVGIVLCAAFVLRMVFFYLNQRNNPVFVNPVMDALYHDEWARSILDGSASADDVYFRGPLYPYLLAFLYKLSKGSIAFAVFSQHVIGTMTAGATYLLAREYFSPRVSLVAGLFAALYWPFVYFEGDLLIVTTILFLNTVGLIFLARSGRFEGAREWALLAAGGVVFGLSAIARPSVLVFFPFLPVVLYWHRDRGRGRSRRWLVKSAVLVGAIVVTILPVMVRNYVVGKSLVPVAASGGVNFYIGNNAASDGTTAIVPGTRADWWGGYEDAIEIAERAEGRDLNLAEVSDYYFGKGWAWIQSNPGDAAAHFAKKFRAFWAGPERANNKFIYFFWYLAGMRYVPLPGYWLIAPLGLLGGVLQWRRRRRLSPLYLFVLTYMAGVVAFFVNARFRLPVVPVLILFAAFAAVYLYETLRSRNVRAATAVAGFTAAFLVVNADYLTFTRIRAYSNAFSHFTLGTAYLKLDRQDTALDHYRRAWEINQENPTAEFERYLRRETAYNMGLLYWEKGLCSRAIELLREVRPPRGGGVDVYMLNALDRMGDCYIRRNQYREALVVYREFLRVAPDDMRAVAGMARVEAARGNLERAESMLEAAFERGGGLHAPAYLALARVKRELGKIDEAIAAYEAVANHPEYAEEALTGMAELYQQEGDIDAAIEALRRAISFSAPGNATLHNWLGRLQSQRRTGQP